MGLVEVGTVTGKRVRGKIASVLFDTVYGEGVETFERFWKELGLNAGGPRPSLTVDVSRVIDG